MTRHDPTPMAAVQRPKHLYDLPNEILLKILTTLPTAALLPLARTSTRLHDLARRVLAGNLVAAVGLAELSIILESYHPWAQWTEPYLYCIYLDTPGLDVGTGPHTATAASAAPPLELICPDARAPPCRPRSLALLLRNVYSRFRPLVPGAMTVTETRHPAGGRMPVRTGNIARATSVGARAGGTAAGDAPIAAGSDDDDRLSASAPTPSVASGSAASSGHPGSAAAALLNATLTSDRLRTTNPTSGPDNHAFAGAAALRSQAAAVRSSERNDDDTAAAAADLCRRFVIHRIRLEPDEPFSQLVVQTSLVGGGPQRSLFGRLLPVNSQGVVRLWREWLADRAAADQESPVARTLWVDNRRDIGLRFRVQRLNAADDDAPEAFELYYEELLIRTAHLEDVLARHREGVLGGRSNQSIVFGSFLQGA